MPKMLTDCLEAQRLQGRSESGAFAVCIGRLGPGGLGYIKYDKEKKDWVLTEKGKEHVGKGT